ncbi:hypothetical protein HK096_007635 [Nowakowskiella sp. JEL0078]|nr:hypothetical protein HK096_007635 [Nowakowskiella sp. JEL0078]
MAKAVLTHITTPLTPPKLRQLRHAASQATKSLRIIVISKSLTLTSSSDSIISELLARIYLAATNPEDPLLDVTVVIAGVCGYDPMAGVPASELLRFDREQIEVSRRQKGWSSLLFSLFDEETGVNEDETVSSGGVETRYDSVVLGGTFDHLHAGHKILLSCAAWLSRRRVLCGVIDDIPERMERKRAYKFMQTYDQRSTAVADFLSAFRADLEVIEIVRLLDDFGPTRWDASLQAIVGSKETRVGCEAVNTLRRKEGLNELDIHIINVISQDSVIVNDDEIHAKLSSTGIRLYLESKENLKKLNDQI